jgi:hypothetical protein
MIIDMVVKKTKRWLAAGMAVFMVSVAALAGASVGVPNFDNDRRTSGARPVLRTPAGDLLGEAMMM